MAEVEALISLNVNLNLLASAELEEASYFKNQNSYSSSSTTRPFRPFIHKTKETVV